MSRFIFCYAECQYAECHYAECHYAECHYAECHYAECHYAECLYAECRSANKRPNYASKIQKILLNVNNFLPTSQPFLVLMETAGLEPLTLGLKDECFTTVPLPFDSTHS